MISNITVKNLATIETLSVDFAKGLNIITGETGAGKSVLLGAISLILGGRANSDIIRTGADECSVESIIDISKRKDLLEKIESAGISIEDNDLLIRRTLHKEGKNRIFINGALATLQMLQSLTEDLVDICGQRDHHSLLKDESQQELFDSFSNIQEKLEEFKREFSLLKAKKQELESVISPDKENREDYLKFVINEIENINPKIEEELELEEERKKLANVDKLQSFANSTTLNLYEGDDSVYSKLSVVSKEASNLENEDKEIARFNESIANLLTLTNDLYYEIRNYGDKLESDPNRLNEINSRLDDFYNIKRKYGGSIAEVLNFYEKAKSEVKKTANLEEYINALKAEILDIEKSLTKKAKIISKIREEKKVEFEKALTKELKEVSLQNASIEIKFLKLENFYEKGFEKVSFLFIPNPGETAKPLSKIASGGELSRTMLAIRNVFYEKSKVGVFLFDEIDAGIGGKTALDIAKKLSKISKNSQVICITHLPQIAAASDQHFYIEKTVAENRTKTKLKKLDYNEKELEVARMLGGSNTDTALRHASELIEQVKGKK